MIYFHQAPLRCHPQLDQAPYLDSSCVCLGCPFLVLGERFTDTYGLSPRSLWSLPEARRQAYERQFDPRGGRV